MRSIVRANSRSFPTFAASVDTRMECLHGAGLANQKPSKLVRASFVQAVQRAVELRLVRHLAPSPVGACFSPKSV